MKTITLEEHFVTREFLRATHAEDGPAGMEALRDRLLDLGAGRIAAMDEGQVDMQVLSLAALGVDSLSAPNQTAVMRGVHDELAEAVRNHSTRFAAFATPALKEPANAVKEFERCITKLGFKGTYVDGTTDGKFLDAPEFFPFLEACAALDIPLYLHPAEPPNAVREAYFSGLPGVAGHLLSIAGWGWHAEMGLHTLRLIVSGVLNRLPNLRIIIGHMGEGIPYALARSSAVLTQTMQDSQRTVAEIFLDQVTITTSGYFTQPPFDCCRAVVGLERMMYSIDYPFSATTKGRDYLAALNLNEADAASFTHGLAEKLLKL